MAKFRIFGGLMINKKEIYDLLDYDVDCSPETIKKLRAFVSDVFEGEPRYSVAELEKISETWCETEDWWVPNTMYGFFKFLKYSKKVQEILK